MATPLAAYRSIASFLSTALPLRGGRDDGLVASQRDHLLDQLRAMPCTHAQATELLAALGEVGPFSEDDKIVIANCVIDGQATNVAPAQRQTSKQQTNKHLANYLPASVWAMLFADDSLINKFRNLAEFMVTALGLRNPCEKTRQIAVGIVLLASGEDPEPDVAYQHIQRFAEIMSTKRQTVQSRQTIMTFPEDPAPFANSFPDAFGPDDKPIGPRINLHDLAQRCTKGAIPLRCSNKKIRVAAASNKSSPASSPSPSPQRSGGRDMDMMFSMLQAAKAFLLDNGGRAECPQLSFFDGRGGNANSTCIENTVAAENAGAQPGAHAPAPLAPSATSSIDRPSAASSHQLVAHPLALEDDQPNDAFAGLKSNLLAAFRKAAPASRPEKCSIASDGADEGGDDDGDVKADDDFHGPPARVLKRPSQIVMQRPAAAPAKTPTAKWKVHWFTRRSGRTGHQYKIWVGPNGDRFRTRKAAKANGYTGEA